MFMGVVAKEAYAEYLKSNHWRDLRQLVMEQVDSRCCICYKQDPSNEVHHIYYCGNWYKTLPHHLTVLCDEHHEAVHGHMTGENPKNPSGHYERFYKIRDHLRSMSLSGQIVACCFPEVKVISSKRPQSKKVLNRKDSERKWKARKKQRWERWQKLTDEELDKIESVIESITGKKIKI